MGGGISAERAARGLIDRGVGLIATAGADGHVVAHACFVPENTSDRAELAFAVADAWQGRGIGTLMLAHLAQLAEATGAVTLTAFVHPTTTACSSVLRDSGFAMRRPRRARACWRSSSPHSSAPPRVRASRIAIGPRRSPRCACPASGLDRGRSARRAGRAASAGRGPQPGRRRLRRPLYPINPHAAEIAGRAGVRDGGRCAQPGGAGHHRRRRARGARRGARLRRRAGVRALVVLSAGFGEAGAEGRAARQSCWASAATTGMRLVGPNCLGVLNTAPGSGSTRPSPPVAPPRGTDRLRLAERRLSASPRSPRPRDAASGSRRSSRSGDKADLSGNDFLRFWEQDPAPTSSLLYLESFGNPRRFGQIARARRARASRSSRSRAGARPRARAPRPRTPARCWQPRTSPSTPSSPTPA